MLRRSDVDIFQIAAGAVIVLLFIAVQFVLFI
jgi:hypothetical protein